MSEASEKLLVRQLKILNFWVTTFGVLMLVSLGIIGFFLLQTVIFIKAAGDKISSFQSQTSEQLDVKKRVCEGTGAFSSFIRDSTDACQ